MLQRKTTNLEFITAFIVMILIFYIFMRRGSLQLVDKINKLDTSIERANVNIKIVNDNVEYMFPYLDTLDGKINYTVGKQYELLDSLQTNNELLRKNNKMLEQNSIYLKQIYKKQDVIIDSIKDKRIYYLP